MLLTLAIIVALLVLYAVFIRPLMRNKPFFKPFFDFIEPVERVLWLKSETILIARLKMVSGLLLTLATSLGGIDITPLMPIVPDTWEPALKTAWNLLPLTITLIGWMDESLRKDTTKPLEIVAAPQSAAQEVAVAKVERANAEAKAIVAESASDPGDI